MSMVVVLLDLLRLNPEMSWKGEYDIELAGSCPKKWPLKECVLDLLHLRDPLRGLLQ